MIQIRRGVFETNSSSTHSISIYSDADWRLIKNGVGYIQRFSKIHAKVYTKDEVIKEIVRKYDVDYSSEQLRDMTSNDFNEYISNYDFYPSDYQSDYLETDHNEYITKSGEILHIVCEYGHE